MSKSFSLADNGSVLICGHRGDIARAPENTIPALEATVAAGGNSAEIDAILSGDGEIIVMHDLLVDRTTDGSGAVGDMTLAQIKALDAGGWFGPRFAGTRAPTLAEALAAAHRLDLVLEVEIKEKRRLPQMLEALQVALRDPADRARVMLISFDHRWLAIAKEAMPWVRTGGIVHSRYADPVAVARSAALDQLCIDYSVFDRDQARALHAAGITIRTHAYTPARVEAAGRAGLNWRESIKEELREGLIDTLSGDDVGWVSALVREATGAGV